MALIELQNIVKTYKTESVAVEALKGINLEIDSGEFTVIMGSSGSGKSTLMNIIGCLDHVSEGRYLLKGEDVARLPRNQLSDIRNQTLGFVFQSFHLLPRTTAQENVELPLLYSRDDISWKEIHQRAKDALERVGLRERIKHTPNELSGGQKQRVAIARALVTQPEVLLADEPTGNLDSKTSLEVIDLIQNLNDQGLTTIMVTHEPDIAQYARRTVRLQDGMILSDDTHEPLHAAESLAKLKSAESESKNEVPT